MTSRTIRRLALTANMFWILACGGYVAGEGANGGGTAGNDNTGGSGAGGNTNTGGATVTPVRPPAQHREEATSCRGVHNPPEPSVYTPEYSECLTHADCTEGVNGKCVTGIGMAGGMGYCTYDACETDADCDPGMVCYCAADSAARCLSAGNCQTDAVCGENSYCSPSMGYDCSGLHSIDAFHCHTPNDTCIDDNDCTGDDYCDFNEYDGLWECTAPNLGCAIG